MRHFKIRDGLRWVRVREPMNSDVTIMAADIHGSRDNTDVIGVLMLSGSAMIFVADTSIDSMLGEERDQAMCESGDPPCGDEDCEQHPKEEPT